MPSASCSRASRLNGAGADGVDLFAQVVEALYLPLGTWGEDRDLAVQGGDEELAIGGDGRSVDLGRALVQATPLAQLTGRRVEAGDDAVLDHVENAVVHQR